MYLRITGNALKTRIPAQHFVIIAFLKLNIVGCVLCDAVSEASTFGP